MSDRADRMARALHRAQAGERDAVADIVHELNPLLWHVVRSQGLDHEPAADVVQTTWLEFLRRMRTIHTPMALTAWLVTTAQREAWRERRRQRAHQDQDLDDVEDLPSEEPDLDSGVLADESARTLWQAFTRLPQRCRRLLRIVAMVDRPDYDTVSEALGMPRGSIGPTRGRCLSKLRELLLADSAWSR